VKIDVVEDNDYQGEGNFFEEIELAPTIFGTWESSNIPQKLVIDELSKEIAKRLEYDVVWDKDPRSGHTLARYSSVVYMKPELKKMNETINKLKGNIKVNESEISFLNSTLDELTKRNKESIEKWLHFSDLYFEYLGKDNDWKYLITRGLKLMRINMKINFINFIQRIPFF